MEKLKQLMCNAHVETAEHGGLTTLLDYLKSLYWVDLSLCLDESKRLIASALKAIDVDIATLELLVQLARDEHVAKLMLAGEICVEAARLVISGSPSQSELAVSLLSNILVQTPILYNVRFVAPLIDHLRHAILLGEENVLKKLLVFYRLARCDSATIEYIQSLDQHRRLIKSLSFILENDCSSGVVAVGLIILLTGPQGFRRYEDLMFVNLFNNAVKENWQTVDICCLIVEDICLNPVLMGWFLECKEAAKETEKLVDFYFSSSTHSAKVLELVDILGNKLKLTVSHKLWSDRWMISHICSLVSENISLYLDMKPSSHNVVDPMIMPNCVRIGLGILRQVCCKSEGFSSDFFHAEVAPILCKAFHAYKSATKGPAVHILSATLAALIDLQSNGIKLIDNDEFQPILHCRIGPDGIVPPISRLDLLISLQLLIFLSVPLAATNNLVQLGLSSGDMDIVSVASRVLNVKPRICNLIAAGKPRPPIILREPVGDVDAGIVTRSSQSHAALLALKEPSNEKLLEVCQKSSSDQMRHTKSLMNLLEQKKKELDNAWTLLQQSESSRIFAEEQLVMMRDLFLKSVGKLDGKIEAYRLKIEEQALELSNMNESFKRKNIEWESREKDLTQRLAENIKEYEVEVKRLSREKDRFKKLSDRHNELRSMIHKMTDLKDFDSAINDAE